MTSLLSLFLFLFFFPSPSTSTLRNPLQTPDPKPLPTSEIRQACQATRFPDLCETTLSKTHLPSPPKPIDIILSAIEISSQNLKTAQSMVQSILDSSHNINRSAAANNCIEYLGYSEYRLSSSALIMPRGRSKDAMAWMSAAELYQYDCWQDLYFVNTTQEVNDTMWFLLSLTDLTSNALSMIRSYDLFGADAALWKPPMTERSGFWGGGNGSGGAVSGFRGGFPLCLKADVTVCKEGDGCYRTVQAAVDAAPDNLHGGRKFVIYIKEGVYDEIVRVPIQKKNVVFLGDGMGKTVITGKLYSGLPGIFTYNTATVGVNGDGFMACDLTFENAASGANVHQAVAFRSDSDLSVFERCEFLGHQDTLYARTLRQFYNSCRVAGTVDFIFGNSATFFQDSVILLRPRQLDPEKGETNAVTAQGRTDPAQSTGFVFQNCLINGTEEYMQLYYQNPKVHQNYLGRPWKEYSRTLFIHCNLEVLISPEGWMKWIEDFALSTLYYGEFENSGPGANISGRVSWSSQIPAEHVSVYSVENFIQGDKWIASYPSL